MTCLKGLILAIPLARAFLGVKPGQGWDAESDQHGAGRHEAASALNVSASRVGEMLR